MRRVQVLIVDDSAAMRRLIGAALSVDPDIEITGEAANAFEARQALATLSPDVVTLDVEMPGLSGIDFLAEVMRTRPLPVVMVAGDGAGPGLRAQAAALGAADFVAKPRLGAHAHSELGELARKVKAAVLLGAHRAAPPQRPAPRAPCRGLVVGVGASAGGIEALTAFVGRLPADCPPILVVQHIPPAFVASFTDRLDRASAAGVSVATDGRPLEPGQVHVAPGDHHLVVCGAPGALRVRLEATPAINGFRPSIDVLFHSLARTAGAGSAGVILAGLGRDGVEGLTAMRRAGARTFAQAPGPGGPLGMPKAAVDAGAVERQATPDKIAAELCKLAAGSLSEVR